MNAKSDEPATRSESPIEQQFRALIEHAQREGYSVGWQAAMAAVSDAIASIAETSAQTKGSPIGPTLRGETSGSPQITPGTTPHYVFSAIKKNWQQGLTGSQVVVLVQEGGHKASDASIRTSIQRLKRRKLIVQRHNKWFPNS